VNAGFRVDPDVLDGHARRVEELAGRLRAAGGSTRPLGLPAFGLVGWMFAGSVRDAAGVGTAAVAVLADRAGEHATRLRAAAGDYRRVEQAIATGLGGPR
jgi:hypothetical protein